MRYKPNKEFHATGIYEYYPRQKSRFLNRPNQWYSFQSEEIMNVSMISISHESKCSLLIKTYIL